MSNNTPTDIKLQNEKLIRIMSWVIVVVLTCFGIIMLFKLLQFQSSNPVFWETLIKTQFPVLIALPMAGLGALFITLVLRISNGPLEFEIGSLKFKGGAAPIVFWIVCFMVIVSAIAMLWQSTPT